MVIYEVNLQVQSAVIPRWLPWLEAHILELLELEGFIDAQLEHEPEADGGAGHPAETVNYTVRYRLDCRASLEHYFAHHAARFRADGLQRFSGQFSASRRILDVVDVFEPDK